MAEVHLHHIFNKPYKYKLCTNITGSGKEKGVCGQLNDAENEECHDCGGTTFTTEESAVTKYTEESYEFYRSEGYEEDEIDNFMEEVG